MAACIQQRHPQNGRAGQFQRFAPRLNQLDWLRNLAAAELESLSNLLVYKQVRKGPTLFQQDDIADRFFTIYFPAPGH